MSIKSKLFKRENLMRFISLFAIIVLAIVFEQIQPNFLGRTNVSSMLRDNAVLLTMAVGMTSVLIFGSIDLSMGAMCSVANVLYVRIIVTFADKFKAQGIEDPNYMGVMFLAIACCLAVGCISGLLMGIVHVKLKVPSFIASLGFMSVWTSAAYLISNKAEAIPRLMKGTYEWYKLSFIGDEFIGTKGWIPMPLIIAIIIAVIFYILQSRTEFGRTIFSIGGNERAARIAGMGVDRTKITIFALAGMCAALGGVFLAAKIKSSDPTLGDPYTLMMVASCVLGGCSLSGGKGSCLGTILGALTVTVIKNGLTFIGVDAYWQDVVFGAFVLAMIILSIDRSKNTRGIAVK